MLEGYGLRAIYDAASHVEANLASVLNDKVWIWKSARSHQLVDIQSKLHLVEIKEEDKKPSGPQLLSLCVLKHGMRLEKNGLMWIGGRYCGLIWLFPSTPS